MTARIGFLSSSIGSKFVMALTGTALSLFVLTHMLGNLLIFCSGEAYNKYSHALVSNPGIYVAEAILALLFVSHIFLGIKLTAGNKGARPVGYQVSANGSKGVSLASKTMIYHGAILGVFVILHLITFKFGTYYSVEYDGVVMRDMYRLVIEVFQSPLYVAWYLVCMILLAVHLSHGVMSIFQSLGINHPKYTPKIKLFGLVYAWGVGLGFFALPIYCFLQ